MVIIIRPPLPAFSQASDMTYQPGNFYDQCFQKPGVAAWAYIGDTRMFPCPGLARHVSDSTLSKHVI